MPASRRLRWCERWVEAMDVRASPSLIRLIIGGGRSPSNQWSRECLVRGRESPAPPTLRYSCQLVTHSLSEMRLRLDDLHGSVQPAVAALNKGAAVPRARVATNLFQNPDVGAEDCQDELRRHPGQRASQGKAELLVPIYRDPLNAECGSSRAYQAASMTHPAHDCCLVQYTARGRVGLYAESDGSEATGMPRQRF